MNNEEKIIAMLEKLNSTVEQHGEMLEKHGEILVKLNDRMDKMQDELTCVRLRLELDVEKRFDAVNEGIDAILEKLVPQSRVEALDDDVIVLKTAFKALAQEVADLKKAQ